MPEQLKFGAILFWKNFQFDDGDRSDKLLVVLGAKAGCNIIAVLTTSNPKSGRMNEVCHSALGYYFFKAGTHGWPEDTLVQLYRVIEISAATALQASLAERDLTVRSNLPQAAAAAIRNCLKATKDITPAQIALLE